MKKSKARRRGRIAGEPTDTRSYLQNNPLEWAPPELLCDLTLSEKVEKMPGQSRTEMGATWLMMNPNRSTWEGYTTEEVSKASSASNAAWFPIGMKEGDHLGSCLSMIPPTHHKYEALPEDPSSMLEDSQGRKINYSGKYLDRMAGANKARADEIAANQAALGVPKKGHSSWENTTRKGPKLDGAAWDDARAADLNSMSKDEKLAHIASSINDMSDNSPEKKEYATLMSSRGGSFVSKSSADP